MSFYERNHVVEQYLVQVENHLVSNYQISAEDARKAIARSGLKECLEGCTYIAMHYSSAKAAARVAEGCVHDRAFQLSCTHAGASI